MTPIKELKIKTDAKETIEAFLKDCEEHNFEAVMLVGLPRNDGPIFRTNNCSGMEKAFMVQFANRCMMKWFDD